MRRAAFHMQRTRSNTKHDVADAGLHGIKKKAWETPQKESLCDHGRDRTCNLLIPIVLIVVKRLAIGPRGQLMGNRVGLAMTICFLQVGYRRYI
jgi:hypothetical protein